MSCATDFKSRCDPTITNLDPDGIIKANVLVSMAVKSNKKHPLLFLPDFVEDLINGMYSRRMMEKYHMHTYNDFSMMSSTLKLGGQRSKSHDEDRREENLAMGGWRQQYDLLASQCRLFRPQLVDMLNCSVLRTLVAHAVLRLQYIPYNNIEKSVLESYNVLKASLHMPHDAAFESYIGDGLARKIDSTIARMAQECLLTSIEEDVSVPVKYAHAKIWIRDTIESNKGSIQYQSLVTKILWEFPLFRMLPGRDEIDDTLNNLERAGNIICKRAFWKFAPYSNYLFSPDAYRASVEEMRAQAVSLGRIKFFGRRITPDQFVSELWDLEIGDLDDRDDQVTRIAGLVLSDAVSLQSPVEHVPGFDFVMDFTNYRFRPEQEDMMRKLDFEVRSKTVHCKVMIKDEITVRKIGDLRKVVPDGEQGVVFTCNTVHLDVRRKMLGDRTIQIIDEDGIRAWCAATSTIPCRLNSVARAMYGDSRGKAVIVRSVNYESGMAAVEAAPDHKEMTLPIGCLEEIGPDVDALTGVELGNFSRMPNEVVRPEDDFVTASEEYFEFLCDLASLAPDAFEKGLGLSVHAVHKTRLELMKSMKPEMFGGPHPDIKILDGSQHDRHVEFKNGICSTVNIRPLTSSNPFVCECAHRLNETYRFTLCSHLVAAIIRLGLEVGDCKSVKRQLCAFRDGLRAFRVENVMRVVLALRDGIGGDSEQLLTEYIWSHMPNGGDGRKEDQDAASGASSRSAEMRIRDLLENDSEMLKLLEALEDDMSRLDKVSLRRVVNVLCDH